MTERFQIIHLGNAYDFVVKDHKTNRTYGTFQGDKKSMLEMLNELSTENRQLKQELNCENSLFTKKQLHEENQQLKKQLETEHQMLDNAILLERTRMGKNSLIQYREAIQ